MIVFGTGSMSIKKITPSDLGIETEENASYVFEIRQRYFHLFWIPFFGIGKIWAVRLFRDSDDMYEMTPEIRALIEAKYGAIGSPWYTFFGLIALAVAAVVLPFVA
ncbi:MAG: hypothetical protein GY827_12605 [Cytophagales bacterium]|nr:hypothetical protein [Cytophagales bacterium]